MSIELDFSFSFDKEQLDALVKGFIELPGQIGRKGFKKVIKKYANQTKQTAALNLNKTVTTEFSTGRIARNLKVQMVGKYEPNFIKAKVLVPPGKGRDDPGGAYYAHMVEYGHKITNKKKKDTGRRVPANPFIKDALQSVATSFKSTLLFELKSQLNKSMRQARRRKR